MGKRGAGGGGAKGRVKERQRKRTGIRHHFFNTGEHTTCSTTNWAWRKRASSVKLVQPMDWGGTVVYTCIVNAHDRPVVKPTWILLMRSS